MSVVPTAAGWGLAFCDVLLAAHGRGPRNDISLVQEEVDGSSPQCIFPGEEVTVPNLRRVYVVCQAGQGLRPASRHRNAHGAVWGCQSRGVWSR